MEFPPGQTGVLVKSRDDIVVQIRIQVNDGVDAIKVSGSSDSAVFDAPLNGSAFGREEYLLIADETHRLGRVCTVPARSRESVLYAAEAGFDWLMHASYIDGEGIELCLKHDIAITATMTLLVNMVDSAKNQPIGASSTDVFQREIDVAAKNLLHDYRAGIPLVAGSESGWSLVPYGQWQAKELQIMVDLLRLTPLEAIHAATAEATRCLPRWRDRISKLEIGRLADLIVVDLGSFNTRNGSMW